VRRPRPQPDIARRAENAGHLCGRRGETREQAEEVLKALQRSTGAALPVEIEDRFWQAWKEGRERA
jgi:hypothetical protein